MFGVVKALGAKRMKLAILLTCIVEAATVGKSTRNEKFQALMFGRVATIGGIAWFLDPRHTTTESPAVQVLKSRSCG